MAEGQERKEESTRVVEWMKRTSWGGGESATLEIWATIPFGECKRHAYSVNVFVLLVHCEHGRDRGNKQGVPISTFCNLIPFLQI